MKKGIILEIKNHYLIMLTPNGEFIKGKKLQEHYTIGQEIFFSPYERRRKKQKPVFWSALSIGVSFVIIFLLISNPFSSNRAYAYVTMDMNPSIEMVLNKNLQVIKTHAYNEAGQLLLSRIDLNKNESFSDAAKKLINKSNSLGYLDQDSNIVISSVAADEKNKKLDTLKKEVQQLEPLANKVEANIKIVNATKNERDKAVEKGISTGKFVVEKEEKTREEKIPKLENNSKDFTEIKNQPIPLKKPTHSLNQAKKMINHEEKKKEKVRNNNHLNNPVTNHQIKNSKKPVQDHSAKKNVRVEKHKLNHPKRNISSHKMSDPTSRKSIQKRFQFDKNREKLYKSVHLHDK